MKASIFKLETNQIYFETKRKQFSDGRRRKIGNCDLFSFIHRFKSPF